MLRPLADNGTHNPSNSEPAPVVGPMWPDQDGGSPAPADARDNTQTDPQTQ